tara:strand:+ start:187 stop:993 length:807 start_codon:yes stop_codon:yes gene_type:complete
MFEKICSITSQLLYVIVASLLLLPLLALAQTFTHVHLRVSDTNEAAQWYQTLLGGDFRPGGMASVRYDNGFVGTMLDESEVAPSAGSVIDHFAFSVSDVADKVALALSTGAEMVSEQRQGVTAGTRAIVQDPWGTNFELIEDNEYPGIHHVHLVSQEPEALRDWFLSVFGGEYHAERGAGQLHSIRYDGIWVNISEVSASAVPSRGRSLDHMGFRVDDMEALVEKIRSTGYEPHEIRPANPTSTTLLMFFEGADGIHFEIAEPGGVTR